jgi:neopullulanase
VPAVTPEWVKDAVFYAIFPDRFAKSEAVAKPSHLEPWAAPPTPHGFKGGDLVGVAERLDYLADLGVTALYFNPIFQSASNHRYHTHDYYKVDPILGGDAAFRHLLAEAHRRGFRVILDGVFNHASRGFYQFNHLLELGAQSPYADWFTVYRWPLRAYDDGPPNYAAWWGIPALPKFNISTPAVREFLWGVGQHWLEQGIDGWRLDVPADIADDSFWQEFRRRAKAINPDCYMVGEIWHEARRWLQGDQFDAVTNYQLNRGLLGFFAGPNMDSSLTERKGYSPVEPMDAPRFADFVDGLLGLYDWQINLALLNLLSSHDTARFLTIARDDESALRLATLFQMTYPGPPNIYYGDEIGLTGGNDPECRKAMPWDPAAWNVELRNFVRGCIQLRREHPALRRGTYHRLYASEMVYAFARRLEGETYVIAFNAGTHAAAPAIPLGDLAPQAARLMPVWQGREAVSLEGGHVRGLSLPPRTGIVFKAV